MRSFIAESGVEEVCLDYFADSAGTCSTVRTSLRTKLGQSVPAIEMSSWRIGSELPSAA